MNKIDSDDATKLIKQVQLSHRMAVGFFQRIIPLIDEIAEKLELDFSWHGPVTTAPPKKDKQPSKYWAWDYFPLYNSAHHYEKLHNADGTTNQQDAYVNLTLLLDENFTSNKLDELEIEGEPDPVTLPAGRALLRASVYRPTGNFPEKFYDLINENDEDGFSIGKANLSDEVYRIGFEWPLEVIISSPADIIVQLAEIVGKPVESQAR